MSNLEKSTGNPPLTTLYIIMVWNDESHRMSALQPIKHFWILQNVASPPSPWSHDRNLGAWNIYNWLPITPQSCQIAICNLLCQLLQKVNWEASRKDTREQKKDCLLEGNLSREGMSASCVAEISSSPLPLKVKGLFAKERGRL